MKKVFFKKSNSGRSIFELLAVMAIIGLLSITVVKSYEKAVSKAQAGRQQRQIAMIVKEVQQKIMGSSVPNVEKIKMNDTEFTVGQGKTGPAKDYFGIKVKTTDKSICEELISPTFLSPALITINGENEGTCPGEITFYFPKDPSNTALLEMGDESIFSEDNSSGGSSGSGGNVQNPSDYNNDEKGCSGNNFVYCSNGSCVSDANDCPIVPEDYNGDEEACKEAGFKYCKGDESCISLSTTCSCPTILDCGEHGTWEDTKCACSCDTGWYGNTCNSNCDGWKDVDGVCHLCSVRDLFQATEGECSKCGNNVRKIFTRAKKDYCGLVDCGQGYFQAKTGTCYLCSDPNSYTVADENACLKCGNQREMYGNYCALKTCDTGNFHNDTGKCIPCASVTSGSTVKGTCSECADTDTPLFELNSGRCEPCSSELTRYVLNLSTTSENCNVCANTNYPRFYGLDGLCYSCKDINAGPAAASECSKCNPPRTIFNWNDYEYTTWCGLANCPSDTYHLLDGSCGHCEEASGGRTTQEECSSCAQFNKPRFFIRQQNSQEGSCFSCLLGDSLLSGYGISWSTVSQDECAQCDNRKYCESSGSCILKTETCSCSTILSCGTHGTWDDTKCGCTCDDGWYGDTCNSDCNEMAVNVSATECAKCSNRKYCNTNNTCIPLTQDCPAPVCPSVLDCGEHGSWDSTECKCTCDTGWYGEICDSDCDTGYFKTLLSGSLTCASCSVNAEFPATSSACHHCDNRFTALDELCYNCNSNSTDLKTSSKEECERCDNRKYCEGTGYCILKTNECPCSTSGSCADNSNVCTGYFCNILVGRIVDVGERGDYCGDDYYVPGSGTVQALGTPQTVKSSYLLSPDELSWEGGKNYCDALKTAISAGVTVNGINYANYSNLSYGLAPVPSGCSYSTPNKPENICSELQSFSSYGQLWLNQLCQFDCETSGVDACLATDSSSALSAYIAYRGYVFGDDRSVAHQAMCH